MNADIQWVLENLNKASRIIIQGDRHLSTTELKMVMEYGLEKGYETIYDFDDKEVDTLLLYSKMKNDGNTTN